MSLNRGSLNRVSGAYKSYEIHNNKFLKLILDGPSNNDHQNGEKIITIHNSRCTKVSE